MNTVKLTSGVQATHGYFSGKEQRILTEQNGKSFPVRINEMIASFVKEIGGVELSTLKSSTDPVKDELGKFLNKMLASDKKDLLTSGWLYTYQHEPKYVYTYEYETVDGQRKTHEEVVDLSDGFGRHMPKRFDENAIKGLTLAQLKQRHAEIKAAMPDLELSSYDEIPEHGITIEFSVPFADNVFKDERRCRINLMNGYADLALGNIGKNNLSSHSVLIARSLKYMSVGTPINALSGDIDKMHQSNLEYIRLVLRICEGQVDTELQFEKPKDDKTYSDDKYKVVDLLGEPGFFFPSGAI